MKGQNHFGMPRGAKLNYSPSVLVIVLPPGVLYPKILGYKTPGGVRQSLGRRDYNFGSLVLGDNEHMGCLSE